jgi:phosphatidylinositol phospholipase C delta
VRSSISPLLTRSLRVDETVDVYDGETEPMIYHGKTLTSKITLREVCAAIAKYAFIASPYPFIISAEVHCGLTQQDMIAKIMVEAFGDALISAPIDDRPKIVALPSPEDLKGRILLKAKSLYATENEGNEKQVVLEVESSETSSTEFETPEVKSEWDGAVRGKRLVLTP